MAVFLDIAQALHQRFGKQVFVAELGYPSGLMGPPFPWNNTQAGYPQTPDGQYRYIRDLVARGVQSRAVAGVRPWAPDFCLAAHGWQPMSLFSPDGTANPALAALSDGLRTARVAG